MDKYLLELELFDIHRNFGITLINLSQKWTKMKWFILHLIWLLMAGCHTAKIPQSPPSDKESIHFGHGGGFSGAVNSFVLTEGGYLYSGDGEFQPFQYIGRIKKNQRQQYFKILKSIIDRHPSINQPGNTYKFVTFNGHAGKIKYVWSDQSLPPKKLRILHEILEGEVQRIRQE